MIFSLSYTLWVTDKPSSLHGTLSHTSKPPVNPLPTLITHTLGSRAWNTRLWSLRQGTDLSQLPGHAPALHAPADRSVALLSLCFASAPCPATCPSLPAFLSLVWPLSIQPVSPPDHP